MQAAGAAHLLEPPPEAGDLVVDGAPVGLYLGFAGAADETETAALAFEMGPGAHQPRALIGQRREFHLQHTLPGAGAGGEYLEDQAGAVQHLRPPGALEVALLDGGHRPVDHDEPDLPGLDAGADLGDPAAAEDGGGLRAVDAHHLAAGERDAGQRGGKRHGLVQPCLGRAAAAVARNVGRKHKRAHRPLRGRGTVAGGGRAHSSPE